MNVSSACALAKSKRLRNTGMPFPLGRIGESPHPREYNGCMYFSTSPVLMVRGVPFGARGGFGRGWTDENLCLGALASLFGGLLLAADVESVDERRAQIRLPRVGEVV